MNSLDLRLSQILLLNLWICYCLQFSAQSESQLPMAVRWDTSHGIIDDDLWSVRWVDSSLNPSCVIEGTVNTDATWYGFLTNMSLRRGGGFHFQVQFPVALKQSDYMQSLYLLLYSKDDINRLNSRQTCWQKYSVVSQRHSSEQVSWLVLGLHLDN